MLTLKEPLYYSNLRPGLDVDLDFDRELLVEEQKSSRARARKFSLETNRRRKALEERRKQWDVQQERLREKILQQRKQRVQDATERFQRAHLPPSLRRRPGYGKRVLNLHEALGQIHDSSSLGSYVQHSLTCRSCTSSPKPPGGSSGPHSKRVVSASKAYTRVMQERNLRDFNSSQLIFLNQLQETEHQLQTGPQTSQQVCPQEHPDPPPSPSESLSSLDSLENGNPQQGHGTSPACSNFFLDPPEVQEVPRPPSPQQLNLLSQSKSFLEEVLSQQGSSSSSSPSFGESTDDNQSLQDLTQALEQCNLNGQSESSYTQSTPCGQNQHAQQDLASNSGHMAYCYDRTARKDILQDKGVVVAHCNTLLKPDPTPLEFASLTRQDSKLLGRTLEEKCSKHPSETCSVQPFSGCRHKEQLCQASSRIADNVNADSSRFGNSCHVLQPDSSSQSCKKETGEKVFQREIKHVNHEECKYKNNDPSNLEDECTNGRVAATTSKSLRTGEEPVRFLKGILKKSSKYVVRDAKFTQTYTAGNFVFTRQVAMSIRDSMELTKAKARESENDKSMKKKLRWFDEVNVNDPGHEPQHPPSSMDMVQQKEFIHLSYTNASTGTPKMSSTTCASSCTRQAWGDNRTKEEPTQGPKVQRAETRVVGPCTPHRVCSARTSSGPASYRKGIVIRPQSATEAQHILKTQGKTLMPRPPPRSDQVSDANFAMPTVYITTKMTYNNDCPNNKQDNPVHPDNQPTSQHHFSKTDEGSLMAPAPPIYAYEAVSKGIYALCQTEAQAGSARRPLQFGENGICLKRTPTDEEISLLWHGVRSALASKEVRSSVGRPTVESNMVKNRTCADHSKIQAAVPGHRKQNFIYQATVSKNGPSIKTKQTAHDEEVLDSAVQTVVDVSQLQRTAVVQHRQASGLSALSLEEQRLLQSLDRLNHRMQYVQDVSAGNLALKGVLALDSANQNQSPQTGKVLGATQHRCPNGSAVENCTRSHRRY